MHVLIVEDERLAAEQLANMIQQYDPDIEVIDCLGSVEDTIGWFMNNKQPDLAFMDIQLLDGTSFDVLEKVEIKCPVIFTTAYDQYALQAFQLKSVDYLLKPINYYKLASAMDKLREMESLFQTQPAPPSMPTASSSAHPYKSRFLAKRGNRMYSIPTEKIAYCFSQNKMSFLMSKEGKRYHVNHTLDQLEEMLDPEQFFRVNRQTLTHINSISNTQPYFKGRLKVELKPTPDFDVVVSSKKASYFKEWLDQ